MPFKWRFFRFSNYLHIALWIIFFAILTYSWRTQGLAPDYLSFSALILGVLILIAHCINNLILLSKYYPEKLPGKGFVTYTIVMLVLSMLLLVAVLIITVVGVSEEINTIIEKKAPNRIGILMATFCVLISFTGVHSCWFQLLLRRTIRRNYLKGIDSFLADDNP
jgi:hypothetical protein